MRVEAVVCHSHIYVQVFSFLKLGSAFSVEKQMQPNSSNAYVLPFYLVFPPPLETVAAVTPLYRLTDPC